MTSLCYPLTKKKLELAFEVLSPNFVEVFRRSQGWHEGVVDGAWSLSRLRTHLKVIGFKPVPCTDTLLFVNASADVGVQLFGAEHDKAKNTWKNYTVEVQARNGSDVRPPAHFA
ncbi:hypothetical protein LC605_23055 [Nostoc sp. CHAB 5836]|nr:hypothetical protein [Nostoc sp. CHAB 5836]